MNESVKKTVLLLERILNEFTFHPEDRDVFEEPLGALTKIIIRPHKADMGRILGRKSIHLNALRAIVNGISLAQRRPMKIVLEEPVTGEKEKYDRFKAREVWRRDEVGKLLKDTVEMMVRGKVSLKLTEKGEVSAFDVLVEDKESLTRVEAMQEPLQVIWNAIGKANGRELFIVLKMQAPEDQQPATSDGRFAKAI
jgi:predicted RNA-binding protein YlqC (UPF0109 family)